MPSQDSDYEHPDEHSDSEMYVMPVEENGDDSYEPPPVEQETRTVHPALPFARGEYVGEPRPPDPRLGASRASRVLGKPAGCPRASCAPPSHAHFPLPATGLVTPSITEPKW